MDGWMDGCQTETLRFLLDAASIIIRFIYKQFLHLLCILIVLNCSSDLWALGCIIYQLLSGHHPFWGRSVMFTIVVL